MWTELTQAMAGFPDAVLTGVNTQGFPLSVRCRPRLDPAVAPYTSTGHPESRSWTARRRCCATATTGTCGGCGRSWSAGSSQRPARLGYSIRWRW